MRQYEIIPYKLPLTPYGKKILHSKFRFGFYIKKYKKDGSFGIGEAAFFKNFDKNTTYLYAKDMAKKHLTYKESFLSIGENKNIKLTFLIDTWDVDLAFSLARKFIDEGYLCLKIKVSPKYLYESIKIINKISKLNHKIKIRLDANKQFNLNNIKYFLKNINLEQIEYFEEPLENFLQIPSLVEFKDLNIALDESWSNIDDIKNFRKLGIKYLILKPSSFFSLDHLFLFVEKAQENNIKIIFSTCFESEYFAAFSLMLISELKLYDDHHAIFCPGIFDKKSFLNKPIISLKEANDFLLNFN